MVDDCISAKEGSGPAPGSGEARAELLRETEGPDTNEGEEER